MPGHDLLQQLVLVYALALVLIVVLGRVGIPSIVAMMMAGAVAGSSGIGLVSTEQAVDTMAREAFPLAIVLASVGTAWVSSLIGISMALGAFLGGLVLAESEFSHQAYAEVRPLRDILASLFFVSVGLLFDARMLLSIWPAVLLLTAGIVVEKAVMAFGALLLSGIPGSRSTMGMPRARTACRPRACPGRARLSES